MGGVRVSIGGVRVSIRGCPPTAVLILYKVCKYNGSTAIGAYSVAILREVVTLAHMRELQNNIEYTRGNHKRVVPAPLWQQNLDFYVICLLTVLFTTSYSHPQLELPPSSALASI